MALLIAVIVPTIPGREESLDRCIRSYASEPDVRMIVWPDSPSSGEGWMRGIQEFVDLHGPPDYVHFTNDDCELIGFDAAKEVCDRGAIPAPIVYNGDATLQSAGGQIGVPDDLLKEVRPDGTEVGFTTIPFLSWDQWEQIGGLAVHYYSDVWFSERGRQLGIITQLCHGYKVIHHTHQVGRRSDTYADDRQKLGAALALG